jgi:SAM-dependent methyltransferase
MTQSSTTILLRQEASGVPVDEAGVRTWMEQSVLSFSDHKELQANASFEESICGKSESEFIAEDILAKSNFLKNFLALQGLLKLEGQERVLEMGACHGWASAVLKKSYPGCTVVATDLLAKALARSVFWEKFLQSRVDAKWASHCRQLPFADDQFDVVFTFASFHHFGVANDFSAVLREMLRVLQPHGRIVLLYEPSCPAFLYKQAFAAVNRRRHEDGVDEDLLVPSRITKQAALLGARVSVDYFPEPRFRDSPSAAAYYFGLSRFSALCRFAMCTVNVTITKMPQASHS